MAGSVYFFEPDGNPVDCFFNIFQDPVEGRAYMRGPDLRNIELVLEESLPHRAGTSGAQTGDGRSQ